jgi:NTE family protein
MTQKRAAFFYPTPGRVALVLAGGAARGAYEIGVVQYIAEEVAAALGAEPPIDILCGTSVGAINACALAAMADTPRSRTRKLSAQWKGLRMADVVRLRPLFLARFTASLLGRETLASEISGKRYGGLLDPTGLEEIIRTSIRFPAITEHLRSGLLSGVSVSATHIATGMTKVFVARAEKGLPRWSRDRKVVPQRTELRIEHSLASAAIPLMFPAVAVDGEFYCDGGLRQNVPLSPARHLGADGLIVVNPRYTYDIPLPELPKSTQTLPGPWTLVGKTLNALLLDRVETDIERLQRINSILLAGQRRYGPTFIAEINKAMHKSSEPSDSDGEAGPGLRPMAAILIDASENIGRMATEYAQSPEFLKRNSGMLGSIVRRLAEDDENSESDLLSYILFDGEFASRLIEVGRHDAKARHNELCRFFEKLSAEQSS